MSVSVTMPRLGESVSEGTVTRWLKKAGERVEADEPLLEVSTDKVDTEIPAPTSGVLAEIKVGEDETVEVGVELAVINEGGEGEAEQPEERAEEASAEAEEASAQPEQDEDTQPEQGEEAPEEGQKGELAAPPEQREEVAADAAPSDEDDDEEQAADERPSAPAAEAEREEPSPDGAAGIAAGDGHGAAYVTPLVRKLAAEQGVDLSQVKGSGVGGRIRKQDVLDAAKGGGQPAAAKAGGQPSSAAQAPKAPAQERPAREPAQARPAAAESREAAPAQLRGRVEHLSRLRKVIAARMVESLQVSAQLTTVVEADVTGIARLREQAKASFEAREGVRLSFLPFFALATVEALKAHPNVNSSIDVEAGTVTYHDAVHLGIAVDTERGLLVPVVNDAQDLNIGGLARKIADLAERTRSGQVSPDELGGGTFTLTNTGSRGALFDTPIINQPQVGILGTGSVVKRPVVIDHPDLGETIAVRSMAYLALTYDHRIIDGADAARFLASVKTRLEEGNFESELGL